MSSHASRVLAVIGVSFVFAAAAAAGVVGSGTPSSCTQAALASQIVAGGLVTFNCGAGPQTIAFPGPIYVLSSNPPVIVDGGDTITFDGTDTTNSMFGFFGSDKALPNVTLRHLVIANGNITTGLNAGGAIQNFGNLTLDHVTLRGNRSAGAGAIFQELCTGCLTPSLNVTNCLFENNTTGGGAISIQGGLASIADSTFRGNSARSAGAIEVYSNATFTVDVTIERCTFSGNSGTGGGGAISVELLNRGSAVRILNDTFNGNSVGAGGKGSAISITAAPVTIANCTIAGNTAADAAGGAIYFGANAAMNNTIVASNSGGNCSFNGSALSGGHNLQFGDSTCPGVTVANPLLSPLADNGGPTQTMALGVGSPAIDAADSVIAPSTDQRGNPRSDGNGDGVVAADIGAYEVAGGGAAIGAPKRRAAKNSG